MFVFTSQESTKASRESRASELYSSIDAAEEKLLEIELKFEASVRDGADTSLSNRGISTLQMSSDRMQSLEEVSEKLKLSAVKEDAFFWLTSCGEAALVKQWFEEETKRVEIVVEAEAELANSIHVDENDRVKESLMKSYNDLLTGYDSQKSTMFKLNKVCVALSKGCNEVIARQLRSNLKSNDVPEDRVKLFWEIKNSVDRFKSRGQDYVSSSKNSLVEFKAFKKGCINALSSFKKKILTQMAKARGMEKARVEELVRVTSETFAAQVAAESARVETAYNDMINRSLQTRYTASNRFQHYITQTQLSRTSTLDLSSAIYTSSVESRDMLQGNYDMFSSELEKSQVEHAEVMDSLRESARGEVESHLKNLNLRLYSTLMTCTNVLNCQMELIHESLGGALKSTQSGNFPLPIKGMFDAANERFFVQQETEVGVEVEVEVADAGGNTTVEPQQTEEQAEETPWVIYYDEASCNNYYYNPYTEESIWEQDAPRDIIEAVEKKIAEVNPNDISGSIANSNVEGEAEAEADANAEAEITRELSDDLKLVVKGYTDTVFTLMDEFFENRIKEVYEEYHVITSNFDRDIAAQSGGVIDEELRIKTLVQEEYAKIDSAMKDYMKTVKDNISTFSVENSSIIENMGSSEMLNGVISFWNGEEVKLGLLNNEMLDMSLPEEIIEITECLDTTRDNMIKSKNKQYSLEKQSVYDKIARSTIASAITDDVYAGAGEEVGDTISLESVLDLPIVKSLVKEGSLHLVGTAMNASAIKSNKDSNNLIEHQLTFNSAAFAKTVAECVSWSSFLKDLMMAKKNSDPR